MGSVYQGTSLLQLYLAANLYGGCPLKVLFPKAMPEGKVELECTTFKWNWKRTFSLLAERADGAEPIPRSCTG